MTPCPLCGSQHAVALPYLRLNSHYRARNVAYARPSLIARFIGAASSRFKAMYAPVAINKAYFNRQAVYCTECSTGAAVPFFEKEQLDEYYRVFYWGHRDDAEGAHLPDHDRPNELQLGLARTRTDWLSSRMPSVSSVLDFGAGDCAAGYVFKQEGKSVHVVDPSDSAKTLAAKYGLCYSADVGSTPQVDLVYSAHSLEHVHDLVPCFEALYGCVKPGGYLFVETPNVEDIAVFQGVVLTPHTFALSATTFRRLATRVGAEILSIETLGPLWSDSHPGMKSSAKTDIRVLMRKPG